MEQSMSEIQSKIDELEEEVQDYEFGSYPYDVCTGELQFLYARLDRMKNESNT